MQAQSILRGVCKKILMSADTSKIKHSTKNWFALTVTATKIIFCYILIK